MPSDQPATGGSPSPQTLPQAPAEPRSWGSARAWAVLLTVTFLGLWSDLWTKSWAFRTIAGEPVIVERSEVLTTQHLGTLIPAHPPVVVAKGLLEFTLVLNPGAVFGMGAGQRWFFVIFTGCALMFGLWLFGKMTHAREYIAHTAVGLLLSGGLGNLYDRLVFGCVRDFIHPLPGVTFPFGLSMPWGSNEVWPWVSNVADLWLIFAIAILLVRAFKQPPMPAAA